MREEDGRRGWRVGREGSNHVDLVNQSFGFYPGCDQEHWKVLGSAMLRSDSLFIKIF